jgi:hypothetical protein
MAFLPGNANEVVAQFLRLSASEEQDVLEFLRSL